MGSFVRMTAGILGALLFFQLPAKAQEKIEEVGDIEVVAAQPADSANARQNGIAFSQLIGRFHPAIVHLPIGFVMAICLIELLALLWPGLPLGKSGLVLSIAAAASFVPAMTSGLLRARELYSGNRQPELFLDHRLLILIAAGIFIASLVLRLAKKDDLAGASRFFYLGLLFISAIFFAAGGHHGGLLVYGENFLSW